MTTMCLIVQYSSEQCTSLHADESLTDTGRSLATRAGDSETALSQSID